MPIIFVWLYLEFHRKTGLARLLFPLSSDGILSEMLPCSFRQIIKDIEKAVRLRSFLKQTALHFSYLSYMVKGQRFALV